MSSEFQSEKKLISLFKNSVFIYINWQEMFIFIKSWDAIGIPIGKAADFPNTSLFDGYFWRSCTVQGREMIHFKWCVLMIYYYCSHGLRTPKEAFFHLNQDFLGLGRQMRHINSGAFEVFSAELSAPILVQWVPCFP
jgi:hypothetical protein